jgi:hypothetical protein
LRRSRWPRQQGAAVTNRQLFLPADIRHWSTANRADLRCVRDCRPNARHAEYADAIASDRRMSPLIELHALVARIRNDVKETREYIAMIFHYVFSHAKTSHMQNLPQPDTPGVVANRKLN